MTDWMARAQAEFADVGHPPTARTDETPLSTVLTVPPGADPEMDESLSTVSSGGGRASFENRILALDLIAAAMKVCDRYGDSEAAARRCASNAWNCRLIYRRICWNTSPGDGRRDRSPVRLIQMPERASTSLFDPERPLP